MELRDGLSDEDELLDVSEARGLLSVELTGFAELSEGKAMVMV